MARKQKEKRKGFYVHARVDLPLPLPKNIEGLGQESVHGFWKDLTDEMVAEFC